MQGLSWNIQTQTQAEAQEAGHFREMNGFLMKLEQTDALLTSPSARLPDQLLQEDVQAFQAWSGSTGASPHPGRPAFPLQ